MESRIKIRNRYSIGKCFDTRLNDGEGRTVMSDKIEIEPTYVVLGYGDS